MVNVFVNDVRECLKIGGFASSEQEREIAGTFLVGISGRLFTVFDNYQIAESFSLLLR